MSHELRTPITGIIGYAELIIDESPETHEAFAQQIQKSGHRLSDTLQSVLDMAQIEAGTLDLTVQETDVASLARDVVNSHRPTADEKDIDLSVSTNGDPHLETDRTLVYRILNNLVHNAVKFTPSGFVRVTLRAYSAGMQIAVTDSGIGIDADFRERLFEPFQQESDGRTRHFEGTGLGLAITKHMVDLLGGSIRVETEKGEGSTFRVDLPRSGVAEATLGRADGEAADDDGASDTDSSPIKEAEADRGE
jgi:signal transduction histidine kinase